MSLFGFSTGLKLQAGQNGSVFADLAIMVSSKHTTPVPREKSRRWGTWECEGKRDKPRVKTQEISPHLPHLTG